MMKKMLLLAFVVVWACTAAGTVRPEVMTALETMSLYVPCDDLETGDVPPSPVEVKVEFGLSDAELLQAIVELSMKYEVADTNENSRMCRETAISWIGEFGNTNNLGHLAVIMTNSADYAQQSAIGASLCITKHLPDLIPLARSIVTNSTVYSLGLRRWTQVILHNYCDEGHSDSYIDDPAQHARIAAFFIERAALEHDRPLGADYMAYTLNPWYRHSQQRRDNLAALRPPGLTGKPAELYDAAQRDAAQEE